MKRIKMMLVAIVAVMAMGAFSLGTANAIPPAVPGEGEIVLQPSLLPDPAHCDFTFSQSGWTTHEDGSYSADLSNFQPHEVPPPPDPNYSCGVLDVDGSGTITKTPVDPITGEGDAEFVGSIYAEVDHPLFGPIQCYYDITVPMKWHYDSNGNKVFTNTGTPSITAVSPSSTFCPGRPLGGSISLTSLTVILAP